MHVRHLVYGDGSAAGAADYLLQDEDHKGVPREKVEILTGDPYLVADVADSLDTKWKYSSGIISWHPKDKPTSEQIQKVLEDYEKAAFSGLEPDRYCFSAVLHHEPGGHIAVHTFAARVDLETGKSYNPAPPGHQRLFDLVRDKWNIKQGWKSPDPTGHGGAPSIRERTPDLAELYGKRNEAKEALHRWIMSRVDTGMIENRADIKESLEEVGTITREGKDYISVRPDGYDRAIRLKGGVYSEQFNRTAASETEAGNGLSGSVREGKLAELGTELSRALERRAEYNRKRYGGGYFQPEGTDKESNPSDKRRHEGTQDGERISQAWTGECRGADSEGAGLVRNQVNDNNCRRLADHLHEYLGSNSILWQSTDRATQAVAANQGSAADEIWRAKISTITKWGRDGDIRGRADGYSPKLSPDEFKSRLATQLFRSHVYLEKIRWVELEHRRIEFADGGYLLVGVNNLSAIGMSDDTAAARLTAGAIANGWQSVYLTGSDRFVHLVTLELLKHGIEPSAKDSRQQWQIDKSRSDYEFLRAAIGEAGPKAKSRTSRADRAIRRPYSAVGKAVDKTGLADRKIEWACGRRESGAAKNGEIFDRLEQFHLRFTRQVFELSLEVRDVVLSFLKL